MGEHSTTVSSPVTLLGSNTIDVPGGRVTTLALSDSDLLTGVTIDAVPAYGNVTVNPDFTLALVLSGTDYTGPLTFGYTVARRDGTTQTHIAKLDVAAPTQAAGWGFGNFYMLETDPNDDIVVEHGNMHRKVYVSGSETALTRGDIAALNNVSESVITKTWLKNNPDYGGSEEMALAPDPGIALWYDLTSWGNGPTSHWLLFERGYNYGDVGQLVIRDSLGESALHPIHITAWGEGDRPVIESMVQSWQKPNKNFVISDLSLSTGFRILGVGDNFLLDGMRFEGGLNLQGGSGITLRNSEILDNVQDDPNFSDGLWTAHNNRAAGVFATEIDGLLLEGTLTHHNGWEKGYDGTADAGMPPSMFSQNLYLNWNNSDVTVRDNITAQGASFGLQIRSGGYVENNVFLDNNVAVNFLGGNYQDRGPVGHFTLFTDNVVTSAGYKDALTQIGAKDWGVRNEARDSTLLGNIVAHMADPNNMEEIAAKPPTKADPAYHQYAPFFDDTVVFNWNGYEANLDGRDPADLSQITIQNFAIKHLGLDPDTVPPNADMGLYYQSGLIDALMAEARDNWGNGGLTARDIITYFQNGFGIASDVSGDTHHRFVPDALGDGVRWDNRLNWTSHALPAVNETVDLGGNWVNFSDTVALDRLDLGQGGKLQVGSGKLSVATLETGDDGAILIERAGQVWLDGYSGDAPLSVQITDGRFANIGDVDGPIAIAVEGGQVIIATNDAGFALGPDSVLQITGAAAKVGFDGAEDGAATLIMHEGGQLSFIASAEGLGRVNEFRSGAWAAYDTNVQSGVALDGTLALDLSSYIGAGSMRLIDVDALTGTLDAVSIYGLGSNRDAELVIDYVADQVTLELSGGAGEGRLTVIGGPGDGADENRALWAELIAGSQQSDGQASILQVFEGMIDALPDLSLF